MYIYFAFCVFQMDFKKMQLGISLFFIWIFTTWVEALPCYSCVSNISEKDCETSVIVDNCAEPEVPIFSSIYNFRVKTLSKIAEKYQIDRCKIKYI